MITIPLAQVPAQTLNVALDGQSVTLSIYTLSRSKMSYLLGQATNPAAEVTPVLKTYMDVTLAGTVIRTCMLCLNCCRVLAAQQYSAFVGDFVFVDTQGTSDPLYTGLGTRWQLVYIEASDLAASSNFD